MRYDGGWIKLHRKISTSWLMTDMNAFCMFVTLLIWANRKDSRIDGEIVKRGEILTSMAELARRIGGSRSTAHRTLHRLMAEQMVEQRRSRRGTILTIVNFGKYQGRDNEDEQAAEQSAERERNSSGTAAERKRARIGELENLRREEEKNKSLSTDDGAVGCEIILDDAVPIRWEPLDEELGQKWLSFALQEQPWRKKDSGFCIEKFAEAIRKVRSSLGLRHDEMAAVFDFIRNDDFWKTNAFSPNGLMKRGANGSRKIDNILARMKPKEDKLERNLQNFVKSMEGIDPTENPIQRMLRNANLG